jgi:biopolymer transport protein ExbD
MKFPRTAKLLRSPFDAAPFAAVFFAVLIFLVLGALLPNPGLPLQLPSANQLPGTDQPTVSLAVDLHGRYFFENQLYSSGALSNRLATLAHDGPPGLTLVIQADKTVTYDQLVQIALLARNVGITNALLATMPSAKAGAANPP